MVAAFRAQIEVVQIHVGGVATTWNDAAASVAKEDLAADRGRGVLCGALMLTDLSSGAWATTQSDVDRREFTEPAHVGLV